MACLPIVPVAVTLYCARAGAASATVTTMTAKTAKIAPLHLTSPFRVVTEPDVLFYEERLLVSSERMFSPGRKYDSSRKGVVGPGLLCNYPDRAAVWVRSTGDKYHEIRLQDHFDEARRIPDGLLAARLAVALQWGSSGQVPGGWDPSSRFVYQRPDPTTGER
jgi:hypothetical protein